MTETDDVEDIMHAPNISLGVLFDTIKIEITCSGDYEAQVLFDDLVGRLQAGQEISIKPGPPDGQSARTEK